MIDYALCPSCLKRHDLVAKLADGTYKSIARKITFKPSTPREKAPRNPATGDEIAVPTRMRVPDPVSNYKSQATTYQPPFIRTIPDLPEPDMSQFSDSDRFFDGQLSLSEADNRLYHPSEADAELFKQCYRSAFEVSALIDAPERRKHDQQTNGAMLTFA